jgi:hypothetical protein
LISRFVIGIRPVLRTRMNKATSTSQQVVISCDRFVKVFLRLFNCSFFLLGLLAIFDFIIEKYKQAAYSFYNYFKEILYSTSKDYVYDVHY